MTLQNESHFPQSMAANADFVCLCPGKKEGLMPEEQHVLLYFFLFFRVTL